MNVIIAYKCLTEHTMLKVIYNFMPNFNFNSNHYKYCVLVI